MLPVRTVGVTYQLRIESGLGPPEKDRGVGVPVGAAVGSGLVAGADDAGVSVGVEAGLLDVGVGVGVGVLVAWAVAVGPAALRFDVDGAVATVPGVVWRVPAGAEVVPTGAGVAGTVVLVAVEFTGGVPAVGAADRSRLREAWSPARTGGA